MADSKKTKPLVKGTKGRDANGRFKKGEYEGGPGGSPYAKQAAELKAALYKAVTPKDIEEIAEKLLAKAKRADIPAIKELFDRLWGKSAQPVNLGDAEGGILDITVNVAAPNNK